MVKVVISSATLVPDFSFVLSICLLQPTTYLGPFVAFTMTGNRTTKSIVAMILGSVPSTRTVRKFEHDVYIKLVDTYICLLLTASTLLPQSKVTNKHFLNACTYCMRGRNLLDN